MAIEECPHCIQKVVFKEDGICPSCGKNKFHIPASSREETLLHQELEKLQIKIDYSKKRAYSFFIGSGTLFLVSLFSTLWITMHTSLIFIWYGGIIAGFIGILTGFNFLLRKFKLEKEKRNKYPIKMPYR